MRKHELSIFIDESGDFGTYQEYCPFYIVTFTFHNQEKTLDSLISNFDEAMRYLNIPNNYMHAGPIIRQEGEYYYLSLETRRKALSLAADFVRKAPINYCTFIIERCKAVDKDSAIKELTNCIENFIFESKEFFDDYSLFKVYYDNGQKDLSNIIRDVLPKMLLRDVIFKRNVAIKKYKLCEMSDVICTLELINKKIAKDKMSKSESIFFKTKAQFQSNFYRKIEKKKIGK